MTKNMDGHVRISAAEKAMMDEMGIGFSRVFRVGLDTLKLWIQSKGCPSCFYLYNTGQNRAPPAAASLPPSEPSAQACPCPACPIRAAFGHVPHERCGQKENQSAAAADESVSCS
jgi:hypothetical protein